MRWPIRNQLLAPLTLLLVGAAGASLWTALASAQRTRDQLEQRIKEVAHNLVDEGNYPLSENVLKQMKRLSGADFVFMPDDPAAGAAATQTLSALPTELAGASVTEDWQSLRLGPTLSLNNRRYLCGAVRLPPGRRTPGILYILYPENELRDALWAAAWPTLALGGSVGLAAVALAVALAQRLSRRVGDLERRTRLIAGGDFSPMPLPARDDEIRDLTSSVNDMAGQLARLQDAVRRTERLRLLGQVSGGLAHQLRNGLTGARLAVQVFVRESEGFDTTALDVALRQLTLLETQLKRFLELGRESPMRRERCPLDALIQEAVELLLPQCRHAGIDLVWKTSLPEVVVVGDSGQLGQLLMNLLGNAIAAAGPAGKVEIVSTKDANASTVAVEVYDTGPGPPAELAARLFEPFVTGKREGVGLGLAVSRQIAEAHGGAVSWRRDAGRTCFRVELPCV